MKVKVLKKIFGYKNKILFISIIIFLITPLLLKDVQYLLFCLSILLFLITIRLYNGYRLQKIAKKIKLEELKIVENEMKKPIWVWKNYYVLTDSYIIKQNFKLAIINISDIVLIYKKISPGNRSFNKKIVIVTNKNEKYTFIIDSTKITVYGHYLKFEEHIKRKNPNVLFGYTKSNCQFIKKKYGFKIYK